MLELVVVVGIFVVTLAVSVASFRNASRNEDLRLSSAIIVDLIREAEHRTVSGQIFGTDVPKGGYGVHLSFFFNESALLFADQNENAQYDAGEEVPGGVKKLLPGTFVYAMPVISVDMTFKPPEPTLLFNGLPTPSSFRITLKHRKSGAERVLTVNQFSHRIDEQ